jgi:hypothetical protein
MIMLWRAIAMWLALALLACSGQPDGADAATANCDDVPQHVQDLIARAASCTPDAGQCGTTIPGICCPITIGNPNAPEVAEIEALTKAFLAQCSDRVCVGRTSPCPTVATGVCRVDDGECAQ